MAVEPRAADSTTGPAERVTAHEIDLRQARRDGPGIDLRVRPDVAPADLVHRQVLDLERAAEVAGAAEADEVLRPFRIARKLTSDDEILQARRLHATVFLAKGFVSAEDLAPDGTLAAATDPWPGASSYFGVSRDGSLTATARQIARTALDLPTLGLDGLSASELRRIDAVPPETVVEISALARHRRARSCDVTAVYVRMWQESVLRRHRVWLMAVDLPLFSYLTRFFCGRALRPIGPDQVYLGSAVVPAVLWCDELGPEQRRMSASAHGEHSLRALLPRLFPDPRAVPA